MLGLGQRSNRGGRRRVGGATLAKLRSVIDELWAVFLRWWATIDWGDAPTWVGAIGTTAAVLLGVHTWRAQLRREDLVEFNLVKITHSVGGGFSVPFYVQVDAYNSNPHPIPIVSAYSWDGFWRPRVLTSSGGLAVPPGATASTQIPLRRSLHQRDFYVMVQGSRGEERLFSLQGKPLGFFSRRVVARKKLRQIGDRIARCVGGMTPNRVPRGGVPMQSRRAGVKFYWRTLALATSALWLAVWLSVPFRGLMLLAGGLLAAVLLGLPLLGKPEASLTVLGWIVAMLLAASAVVTIHTLWRLLNPNRLVLFAPDLGSSIDVIFKSRQRISFANHGRAFRATSAPSLRETVASWIDDLDGFHLDIRAQNKRVADHYIAQFPRLVIVDHNWMGHVRLAALPDPVEET